MDSEIFSFIAVNPFSSKYLTMLKFPRHAAHIKASSSVILFSERNFTISKQYDLNHKLNWKPIDHLQLKKDHFFACERKPTYVAFFCYFTRFL